MYDLLYPYMVEYLEAKYIGDKCKTRHTIEYLTKPYLSGIPVLYKAMIEERYHDDQEVLK